jgi:hypothetical protein
MTEEERTQACAALTAKVTEMATQAEATIDQDTITNALTYALFFYMRRRASMQEAASFIRGIADDIEASATPPRPN